MVQHSVGVKLGAEDPGNGLADGKAVAEVPRQVQPGRPVLAELGATARHELGARLPLVRVGWPQVHPPLGGVRVHHCSTNREGTQQ